MAKTNINYLGNDIYTMTCEELAEKYFISPAKATRDKRKITSVKKELDQNDYNKFIVQHYSLFNICKILLIGRKQAKELRDIYGINYFNSCFEGVSNEDLMYCTPYLKEKYKCSTGVINVELTMRKITRTTEDKFRKLEDYIDVTWNCANLMHYTKCSKKEAKEFLEKININCGIRIASDNELINLQTSELSKKYKCSTDSVFRERKKRSIEKYKIDNVSQNFKMNNFFHQKENAKNKWKWNTDNARIYNKS